MQYIIGLIGLLFGSLLFFKNKASSAEAMNKNIDTKNAVNKEDSSISKDQGLLASEEQKRQEAAQNATKEEQKDVNSQEIADFFNNRKH